jgi:phosphoribosylaminoimidazole carboxylase (NCAIR synthetase)
MSKSTTPKTSVEDVNEIELRKVKALEKIAASLDALTIWFEEIDKDEWSSRVQYYLAEFHNNMLNNQEDKNVKKK